MRRMRAYTLPEMLAALLVLAVLLGWALPSVADSIARARASGTMMQLRALLHLARSSAIALRRDVTVCGTVDGASCSAAWENLPVLMFLDENLDRRLDAHERLILRGDPTPTARLRWRGSGGRAYLRYRSDGGVGEYGHFLYCPAKGELHHARKLVINATGRPREARDMDGDGIIDELRGSSDCR